MHLAVLKAMSKIPKYLIELYCENIQATDYVRATMIKMGLFKKEYSDRYFCNGIICPNCILWTNNHCFFSSWEANPSQKEAINFYNKVK